MGYERNKYYYNDIYENPDSKYLKEAEDLKDYFKIWKEAYDLVKDGWQNETIIDLGCGPGHFATLFKDDREISYEGYDFSSKAIKQAKKRNEQNENINFYLTDLKNNLPKKQDAIYVSFEFLEHVSFDLEVFEQIESGKKIVFSVPDFDDPSHVRFFKSKKEVLDRYEKVCSISTIKEFNGNNQSKIYLCSGIVK